MSEFDGRVVIITGANGGLGTAVTRAFLDAGATVAGVYHAGAPPAAGHSRFHEFQGDLTTAAAAARVLGDIHSRFGTPHALVHLVGGFAGGQPLESTDDATWRRMLDLNLNAAFYTFRAVLPAMKTAGRGRILAVGSRTALEPVPTLSAYGVSKAALVMLIRTVALEVKGTRITANCVLPSVIDTAANRAADPQADFSRWVRPESIAALLLWLASDAAGDISGAAIPIYGAA